jgi:hypothetical protein
MEANHTKKTSRSQHPAMASQHRNPTAGGVLTAFVQSAKVAVRNQALKSPSHRQEDASGTALSPKLSRAKVFRRAKKNLPPAMVQTLRAWGLGTFMKQPVAQQTLHLTDASIMYQCIHFIKEHGLLTEGIFRISGASESITQGLELLHASPHNLSTLNGANCSVHDASSMLKRTAMKSECPIVPCGHYGKVISVGKAAAKKRGGGRGNGMMGTSDAAGPQPATMSASAMTWRRYLIGFVASLPKRNSRLLGLLFNLLYIVASTKENKMSPRALATVFAPTIFRAPANLPLERVLEDTPIIIEATRILIENAGLERYPELCILDFEQVAPQV